MTRVRLSKAKRTFKKGYLPNWTEELFTVVKCIETNNSSVQLGKYPFLNVRLALLSRTLSPGENLHDFVGPFFPYSLLDTVVWLSHVTSAGGMPMVL
jgi:hypothetical protein